MRLFIWPGAAQEVPRGFGAHPGDAAAIRSASRAGTDFGWWLPANLVNGAPDEPRGGGMAWRAEAERAEARGGRLVMWSGWIDPEDEDDHERAGVRTHGPEGHRRCTEVADRAAAVLEAQGVKLLLRPHARHVLSDVPSCLTFLRSALGERVRLVLDPIGMLTASMAARAEEHLERIMSALARHPGVAAILLASGELVGHGDEQRVERRALHRTEIAIIDSRRLIAMVAEHARPETDLIIIDDGVKEQQEMLRMYGPGR